MSNRVRLLFVDDEEGFLQATARRLALRNIDVRPYTEPEKALAAFEETDFDVAILDLDLPRVRGDTLLKLLKERRPSTEVVIVTGVDCDESTERLKQEGAFECVRKPFELGTLIDTISRAYAKKVGADNPDEASRIKELFDVQSDSGRLSVLEELRKIDKGGSRSRIGS